MRATAYFGVPVSDFFSLDDYIASSIREIVHSLWILLVFLSVILWGYPGLQRSAQSRQPLGMRRSIRRARSRITRLRFLSSFALAGIVWYFIYEGLLQGWTAYLLSLVAVYPAAFIATFRFARKFFSNTLPAQIALLGVAVFFLSTGLGTYNRIKEIEGESRKIDFRIKTGNQLFTSEDYSLIGGSQCYIFLRSDQDGDIEIVHRLKAEEITFLWMRGALLSSF